MSLKPRDRLDYIRNHCKYIYDDIHHNYKYIYKWKSSINLQTMYSHIQVNLTRDINTLEQYVNSNISSFTLKVNYHIVEWFEQLDHLQLFLDTRITPSIQKRQPPYDLINQTECDIVATNIKILHTILNQFRTRFILTYKNQITITKLLTNIFMEYVKSIHSILSTYDCIRCIIPHYTLQYFINTMINLYPYINEIHKDIQDLYVEIGEDRYRSFECTEMNQLITQYKTQLNIRRKSKAMNDYNSLVNSCVIFIIIIILFIWSS